MKNNKLIFVSGVLAIIICAWGVQSYFLSEVEPEPEPHCASLKVIDDMSKELLHVYNKMDLCNERFEGCVHMYMKLKKEIELVP
jgi:hypothetical protein